VAEELFSENFVLPSSGRTVRLQGKVTKAWGGQTVRAFIDLATGPDNSGLDDDEWDEAQAVINAHFGIR
jgi:hypothetical protein